MNDDNTDDKDETAARPKLTLSNPGSSSTGSKVVRQNLAIGRSKNVSVEIRRKKGPSSGGLSLRRDQGQGGLTAAELEDRMQAVKNSMRDKIEKEKEEQARQAQERLNQERLAKEKEEEEKIRKTLQVDKPNTFVKKEGLSERSEYKPEYKPRGDYTPRPPREGDYNRSDRQRSEGNYPPREGGYRPRSEGPYKPREPREGGGYRPEGYRPQSMGTENTPYRQSNYQRADRPAGEGYRPRPEGGYGSRPERSYNRDQQKPEGLRSNLKIGPASDTLIPEDERKRKDLSLLKEREKKNKKFTDFTAESKKTTQHDKRQSKRVDLTRYRDIENIEDENLDTSPEARLWMKKRIKTKKELETDANTITREVVIPKTIIISELANRMAVRASEVIKKLMQQGMFVTVNQVIDGDIAEIVCTEFGRIPKRVSEEDIEKVLIQDISPEDLTSRAPVVTVMGHVDHGKTSLLDALRKTTVVKGEAGGITQHIGAYRIFTKEQKPIVFIDTPGHAAFSSMRSRGAHITDIVVLVVAADDGVKAQTIEAIKHAKAAKVPIIVAVNKIDLPAADVDRVCSELLEHEVVAERFGGDVMVAEISAKSGKGLDKLEDDILLLAETLELKASANKKATGVVVESTQEKGRGAVATVLVQSGTLRVGDIFVVGKTYGKVKLMMDEFSKSITEALPSTPVRVLGLDEVPEAGDTFNVVEDEQIAISIAESRARRERDEIEAKKVKTGGLAGLLQNVADSNVKVLPVIIKGDVHGSIEAIKQSLEVLSDENTRVNILHAAVGPVSENDVSLAKASRGIIIAFNVRANAKARDIAKQEDVEVFYHSIIYNVIDDVKNMLKGFLKPIFRDKFIGYAEIRQVFNISKVGNIAGCMVTEGVVQRGAKIRLLRDNVVIHEGKLKTLKRFKDEVKEVRQNYECGMAFENYNDIKVGDMIECSIEEEVKQ